MAPAAPHTIGRYALHGEIGSGGMATVYLGHLHGIGGFSRPVAIKRVRRELSREASFVTMLLDEARLASRVRHPNVVSTLDVGFEDGELFLVLDYVHGEPLSRLIPGTGPDGVPHDIAVAVLAGTLRGLHAAHEARGKDGAPLGLVHRDVSPPNVLVGADGMARVLDFGVAKAAGRLQETLAGVLKGKVAYMASEQLLGQPLDRRADVFAASVVLWETLTGRRLFSDDRRAHGATVVVAAPSTVVAGVPADLDAIVACGLDADREARFSTAEAMAVALENAVKPASPERVAAWVQRVAGDRLAARAAMLDGIEGAASTRTLPAAPLLVTPKAASTPATAPMPAVPAVPATGVTSRTLDDTSLSRVAVPPPTPRASPSPRQVSSAQEAPPSRRSSTRLGVIALVAASLGAGGVLLVAGSRSAPEAARASAASASPLAVPLPAPMLSATALAPEAASSAATAASASATAPSTHAPSSRIPVRSVARSCDPPYRVDAEGIRHPKPECY